MNVSRFDFNHAKTLYFLLEEAHVARAALHLGITPAAASNALRRLREEVGDPLLVRQGRGLVRTRLGEELRVAAGEVVRATDALLGVATPFDAATFAGDLPVSMADHVATLLLPALDGLARELAPAATLSVAAVPLDVEDWLEQSGGVLIGPLGSSAAVLPGDRLSVERYYEDQYVCLMRRGHPLEQGLWTAAVYASQNHVLVTPRGRSRRSDIDDALSNEKLARNVVRVVPNFSLALALVARSELITTVPARFARHIPLGDFSVREVPLQLPLIPMNLVVHPAHARDPRVAFIKELLWRALGAVDAEAGGAGRPLVGRAP